MCVFKNILSLHVQGKNSFMTMLYLLCDFFIRYILIKRYLL